MYLMWVVAPWAICRNTLAARSTRSLLVVFVVIALRHAQSRNLAAPADGAPACSIDERRGFFRLGLLPWLMIHQQPVGFDPKTFTGPFLTFLVYAPNAAAAGGAGVLLPCAAQRRCRRAKWLAAAIIAVLALATAGGIVGATMGPWLPRL